MAVDQEWLGDQRLVSVMGERVTLGPMRRDSLPLYRRWMNDFVTIRGYEMPAPLTSDAVAAWYEDFRGNERHAMFGLFERATMRLIGHTGLINIDRRHRNAEFDILIGEPDCRGRGYGGEATRLIQEYAFVTLGLETVYLRVLAFNEAGIRAYRKAGYREAGRLRNHWFVFGRHWDMVYMDCLASEYRGMAGEDGN